MYLGHLHLAFETLVSGVSCARYFLRQSWLHLNHSSGLRLLELYSYLNSIFFHTIVEFWISRMYVCVVSTFCPRESIINGYNKTNGITQQLNLWMEEFELVIGCQICFVFFQGQGGMSILPRGCFSTQMSKGFSMLLWRQVHLFHLDHNSFRIFMMIIYCMVKMPQDVFLVGVARLKCLGAFSVQELQVCSLLLLVIA